MTENTIEIGGQKMPRPIKDRILIRQDKKKDKIGKEGLLFAPQGAEDYPDIGTVLAVGEGGFTDSGVRIPLDVKVGDRVYFRRKPSSAVNYDREVHKVEAWEDLLVLPESCILLVIDP